MTEFEKLLLGSIDPVSVVIWDVYNHSVTKRTIEAAKEAFNNGNRFALIGAIKNWVAPYMPMEEDYDTWLKVSLVRAVSMMHAKHQITQEEPS